MGNRKETTKQTTNQVTNQTSTPNAPSWYTSGLGDLGSQIAEFGRSDPLQYVAPASPLQQQAFGAASGLLGPMTNPQPRPAMKGGEDFTGPQINGGGGDGYVAPGQPTQGGMGGMGDYRSLYGNAANLVNQSMQGYDPAMAEAVGVGAVGLLDGGLEKYLNPYTGQVTDAYKADAESQAGQIRAQQAAQAAKAGAFGGSRFGVREAQTEEGISRARAAGLASILQGGFDRATGLADSDAARAQQAAIQSAANAQAVQLANAGAMNQQGQFMASLGLQGAGLLGDLGSSIAGNNRADIGLLSDLGAQQQQIDANQRTASLSQLQALAQLYGGIPTQGLIGQTVQGTTTGTGTTTTSSNPGLLGTIGQGAQTAASLAALFSDYRLKENVKFIGEVNGYRAYSYNYIWSDRPEVGVMAQEVQAIKPDAVSEGPGGFLMVDYARL
jgi:hypothetical protein